MANKLGNPMMVKGGPPLNPHGRPPGSQSLKTQAQEAFLNMMRSKVIGADGQETIFLNAFNDKFMTDALTPGTPAYRFIADRLYGMDILADIDNQVNKARREDADFIRYRICLRAFDIQQRILMSHARDIVLMAGRRAGKSETNKLKSIDGAVRANNQRILIIGLTIMKTTQIYWDDTITILTQLGIDHPPAVTENRIGFPNGSFIQYGGNSSKVEREKYRGQHWDGIIIDEAQSQAELGNFIKEIINPMLMDTNGWLMVTGSGPRTRGTSFEHLWHNPSPSGLRINWNLSQNPNIHDYENALATEREKHGLAETDSLFMREYLGLIVYDDESLAFRLNEENYYTEDELDAWLASQSPADIKFTAGLDYGFVDSDAFIVVMYSEKSNSKFIVHEYKKSGTDVTTLVEAIKQAKVDIAQRFHKMAYNQDFNIYADTSDQKIGLELSNRYGIPVHNAMKYDKTMAIQMLQEEVRSRRLKVKKGSHFDHEALRIIFKRFEKEGQASIITKEIDDEVYHPDMMDALLYSLRHYWLTHQTDHFVAPTLAPAPFSQEIAYDHIQTQDLF